MEQCYKTCTVPLDLLLRQQFNSLDGAQLPDRCQINLDFDFIDNCTDVFYVDCVQFSKVLIKFLFDSPSFDMMKNFVKNISRIRFCYSLIRFL